MPKTYTPPQPFSDKPCPDVKLHCIESSQLHSIGYDAATETLAIRFLAPGQRDKPLAERQGGDAVYHYPGVIRETWDAFRTSQSLGTFFGQHFKKLTFDKFRAEAVEAQS